MYNSLFALENGFFCGLWLQFLRQSLDHPLEGFWVSSRLDSVSINTEFYWKHQEKLFFSVMENNHPQWPSLFIHQALCRLFTCMNRLTAWQADGGGTHIATLWISKSRLGEHAFFAQGSISVGENLELDLGFSDPKGSQCFWPPYWRAQLNECLLCFKAIRLQRLGSAVWHTHVLICSTFFTPRICVSLPLASLNVVSLLHEEVCFLSWDWYWECALCGDRWKVTGQDPEAWPGRWWRGSIPFTKLSHTCSLPSVTVSQICSLRGKMIPEELEKRVQEAKKEVRGPGEGGRGNVPLSGPEGEDAGAARPPLCVGEGGGPLRVGGGSSSAELLCLVLALSVLWSFSNMLIPGGWSLLKHGCHPVPGSCLE